MVRVVARIASPTSSVKLWRNGKVDTVITPNFSQPLPTSIGAIHFVGIGGSGMSGIAQLFLQAGHRVTGSDRSENQHTIALRKLGVTVTIGHNADSVEGADVVVFTSALWPENPEYLRAVSLGLPTLHRSQALAWLIGNTPLVAVAGAHGKTTSTGMIVTALLALGQNPSFVNGGVIQPMGVNSATGTDDLFVIEADESDGSFLLFDTAVALVTNIDTDHLDHYGSRENFDGAFVDFVSAASDLLVISSDDPGAVRVARARTDRLANDQKLSTQRVITFGHSDTADVRLHSVVTDGPVSFAVHWAGRDFRATLQIPGAHNAINAAGAFAVLVGLGWEPQAALDAVATFGGTARRFELHDVVRGVSVYDDYAHHPAEVSAALTAARSVVGTGRIIAVHQPHLYSRTQAMAGQFAEAYEALADHTVVLDVHGAREDPVPGVTGALVTQAFADSSRSTYLPDWQEAADFVGSLARPGDIVMTLSCGDVYRIIPQLISAIENAPRS
jgi:UDP-N-acetylmuramate--alanine ligase